MGRGYYKEVYFDGVHIGIGNVRLAQKVVLGFESDFETIEMHFTFKGKSTARTSQFDQKVSFDAHSHNILYTNGLGGEMQWESEDFHLCEINLSQNSLSVFYPKTTSYLIDFAKH